jgi:hypothetical protein
MLNEAFDLLTQSMLDDAMQNAVEDVLQEGCLEGVDGSDLLQAFGDAILDDPLLVSRLKEIDL